MGRGGCKKANKDRIASSHKQTRINTQTLDSAVKLYNCGLSSKDQTKHKMFEPRAGGGKKERKERKQERQKEATKSIRKYMKRERKNERNAEIKN